LQTASDRQDSVVDVQPTGLVKLDELLKGGLPRGRITEISGAVPSGKTSLLLSLLAEATREGKLAAYIDTFSCFDPESAGQAGILFEYLLWIRCKKPSAGESHDSLYSKALKAADILIRSNDFPVVILDMIAPPPDGNPSGGKSHSSAGALTRFPSQTWFRLQRAVKGTSTAFLILTRRPLSGSAASVALSFKCTRSRWIADAFPLGITGRFPSLAVGNQFQGIESEAHLLRGSRHGSITVYCRL
jgi:RecA/RadA recombinase